MVTQYPHTATMVTPGTEATQDADGNWQPGTPDVTTTASCRAESSTGDGYISGVDGNKIGYTWIVYLPSGTQKVKVGTSIVVVGPGIEGGTETILEDTVKRFSRGQLNCRIWL